MFRIRARTADYNHWKILSLQSADVSLQDVAGTW